MVSGPESTRVTSRSSNQSSGGDGAASASAKVPTEEELGALFDQAMKAQQQEDRGDKAISPEEQQKFLSAMKDPEFRSLLNDYMHEISDPKHRAETEQYLSQLESEQRVPEDKELVKPLPGFVVKTKWSDGSKDSKVFINVCSSGKLQPPSSTRVAPSSANDRKGGTSWHLPYSVGPERMESDKGGAPVVTFDVCFHTRTLELAKVQREFHEMVVKIGLDAVESLLRESRRVPRGDLSRKFHVLKGVGYKSGEPVTMCLRKPSSSSDASKSAGGKQKATKTNASVARSNQKSSEPSSKQKASPPIVDNQKDVIDVVVPDSHASGGTASANLLETKGDAEPLLREVATTKTASVNEPKRDRKLRFQMIYRGKFELMHHMQAEHDNVVPADRNRPKELVIEVEFPLATSAKGINLDVSETVVRVSTELYDPLSIPLPFPVVEAKGSAKFDKKQRKLVVTLPVQPPPPPAVKSVSIVVEEEDEEEVDGDQTQPEREQHRAPSSSTPPQVINGTPQPPKEDEFRMLRETALMVANDPLVMARTAPRLPATVAADEVDDDMPPLESCSEDEDGSVSGDGSSDIKDDEPVSTVRRDIGDTHEESLDSEPAGEEAAANTPAFAIKETSACVSFLIDVANVNSTSVKLSFPSPTSMRLRFTATTSIRDGAASSHPETKAYTMDVTPLPHAVRPETSEVDVATENMVVILEKATEAKAEPAPTFGPLDPVARFQNDLLYELD